MGVGHGSGLHLPGTSLLHRLPPECKLLAVFAFVLLVVATPREQFWAFGVFALVLVAVARVGRVPLGLLARRLVIEVPFVLFAVLLPFVARGERVDVLGLSLSESGLLAAFNILAKATLGATATILLATTTDVRGLLRGLERLRLPRSFVAILSFMVRYADVVAGEMQRMRIARASRGYDPKHLLQARALAASAGALFLRAYERGERVYLAMVSRGWSGAMPVLDERRATGREWATALALPAAAALVSASAWVAQS
ncbi:MAG TPA: cobalt ECF transporter T component CbiQ [Mycobacteriales bacterium]|nr:cobalt ECF transporter T component CbiQ [Mycobacteriales bacterium]